MSQNNSTILSTHSGHHRIFIGPVVQKRTQLHIHRNHNHNPDHNHGSRTKRSFSFQSFIPTTSARETKPWWEHPSLSKSILSLSHTPHRHRSNSTNPLDEKESRRKSQSLEALACLEFSESSSNCDSDSEECSSTGDEKGVSLQSGTDDEDYDVIDNFERINMSKRYPHRNSTSTGSSEVGGRVGQMPSPTSNEGHYSLDKGKGRATEVKGDQQQQKHHNRHFHIFNHASFRHLHPEEDTSSSEGDHKLIRWRSKEKKKTRDEGERGKIRRIFSQKEKVSHRASLFDDPDLEFDNFNNGHNNHRRPTSGALDFGGKRHKEGGIVPHPILVGSPFSSETDLPNAINGGQHPVFVSSPNQSAVSLGIKDDKDHDHDPSRPGPTPIQQQNPTSQESAINSRSSYLGPSVWYPANSSLSGGTTSANSRQTPKRGETWMTARESASSMEGNSSSNIQSYRGHPIVEVPEDGQVDGHKYDGKDIYGADNGGDITKDGADHKHSDNNNVTSDDDGEEHYTLAKMISNDSSVDGGAGVGVGSISQTLTKSPPDSQRSGLTKFFSMSSTSESTKSEEEEKEQKKKISILKKPIFKSSKKRPTLIEEELNEEEKEENDDNAGVNEDSGISGKSNISKESTSQTDVSLESKEPLSRVISKASTRFGNVFKSKSPTMMKKKDDKAAKHVYFEQSRPGTSCSDHNCNLDPIPDNNDKKKVRFMTKVQYHKAASRQCTASTSRVIKQDRMLVRKEVTERPGPQLYNSVTARRMERQSLGWKEWWCILKSPPSKNEPITKITKVVPEFEWKEKGRLEFYYNHKKINSVVMLTSNTTITVYSSLDYSMAITQNFKDAAGLTVYIIRPRTISLACSWYMEIYTLLHGKAPIPNYIDLAVPDFDVKIRVPIPDGADSDDDDYLTESDNDDDDVDECNGTELSSSLPLFGPINTDNEEIDPTRQGTDLKNSMVTQRFKTPKSYLPYRMAAKTFYLNNDQAKPTLVTPDQVTPKKLRDHALSLLKQVPDWTDVVSMWQDPNQHGDVALCWKRYDRIEWIYWTDNVFAETNSIHLRKDHMGFADGSEWSGGMDETVVGPRVLDKTHRLELRPITHYPTKVMVPQGNGRLEPLPEPDPIEGYLVRTSTFSGNPLSRFRRLYLASHDHLLIYTTPANSHSPSMDNAGYIDPESLVFSITPHKSANPDLKDMSQSHSVRRLKAQVRAAQGLINLTNVGSVRVMKAKEWNYARFLSYRAYKERQITQKKTARENLETSFKNMERDVRMAFKRLEERQRPEIIIRGSNDILSVKSAPAITVTPAVKPTIPESSKSLNPSDLVAHDSSRLGGESLDEFGRKEEIKESSDNGVVQRGSLRIKENPPHNDDDDDDDDDGTGGTLPKEHRVQGMMRQNTDLDDSEPLSNSLGGKSSTHKSGKTDILNGTTHHSHHSRKTSSFLKKTATFLLGGSHKDDDEDSNIIEIEMRDKKSCVRFRAYSPEAAHLWADQLNKLVEYWTLRKQQDAKDHLYIRQCNSSHWSTTDDDEYQVTVGGAGISVTVEDWSNEQAAVSPDIWNWCIVNGCRSITKAGYMYFKPNVMRTFRRMYVILTEGFLMLFHPYCRNKITGTVIPSTAFQLAGIYSLKDIYLYSGHFSDSDTNHGTNDESENLPRFFLDGLMVDDPDEDCTFSIWKGQRKKMFSRRGHATLSMASRPVTGTSRIFGKNAIFNSMVKDGIVYGARPRHKSVFRARSRPELEEWVYAINTEIERIVRIERKRINRTGRS